MVLYKYLPAQYAAPFVERGEVLFAVFPCL
jgi:hypothetical protein